MKTNIRLLIILLMACFGLTNSNLNTLQAQVVVLSNWEQYQNVRLQMTLQDKETREPIAYATIYLIPDGDSTITHFGLSDEAGNLSIKDVPPGKYQINAEMIGYKPYQKVHKLEGWQQDLGIIRLEQDLQQLETAVVTASGNPILIKNDTIVYNASAYRVGENAMLEDLLKKMPGMEVGEDGTVKVNGEQIDKITVGGKTFFFNDPTAALKNLPAKIVEKIQIIDKESKQAEFSGISSGNDKEKVMDVGLKEEYSEGWFGNAKIGGGYDLTQTDEEKLRFNRGLLYNGNAMITAYSEQDQVTLIANAQNVNESNSYILVSYGSYGSDNQNAFSQLQGLGTSSQIGLNYNTERIKGFHTTVASTYKYNTQDDRRRSNRTSFQAEGDPLQTQTYKVGTGEQESAQINFEIEKEDSKKWQFFLLGRLAYLDNEVHNSNENKTLTSNQLLNVSESNTHIRYNGLNSFGLLNTGYRFKNERRNLSALFSYDYNLSNTDKDETTLLEQGSQINQQQLLYKTDHLRYNIRGEVTYVEPLSEKWALSLTHSFSMTENQETTNASDPDGRHNDYYSSISDQHYLAHEPRLLIQYKNQGQSLQAGVSNSIVLNEIRSRSLGVEIRSGEQEWLSNWAPFLNYHLRKNTSDLFIYYQGNSHPVSSSQSAPVLNLDNRIQIQAGNVYLKPSFEHWLNGHLNWSNRETFTFINTYLNGRIDNRPIVYASWFDEQGIRYAIPVNSELPSVSGSLHTTINQPLGSESGVTLSATASIDYSLSHSYQATRRMAGLDLVSFNYFEFMETFWGNDNNGTNFYNGTSGFQGSKTQEFGWYAKLGIKYTVDKWAFNGSWRTNNTRSFYSLDPTANTNTWKHTLSADVLYQPRKNWEIETKADYKMYRGYAIGFGDPELTWNASIRKTLGKWTLAINAYDLLNQTRNLSRSITGEYWEDSYTYRQGRFVSFSVSLNFGKMSAEQNKGVQNAMWNML